MAWTINPTKHELAFLMEAGLVYCAMRKHHEAQVVFKGVRAILPKSDAPEVALGTVAFQQGDFEVAARHYRRALEINPRSAWAYAHLGELALFQTKKQEARAHLKTAVDLDPRGAYGRLARALIELTDVVKFA